MGKTIRFTVTGNNDDPKGNPIPYTRTTQKSQWTPKAQRYQQWKGRVVAGYLDAIQAIPKIARADFGDAHDLIQRKPIKEVKWKQRMKLMIYYKDEHHPDSDNVFKGIADALFMNDKHLVGEFDYAHDREGGGRVEITIEL